MERIIMTQEQLQGLAREIGVREDWHEPDEQEVTAKVIGKSFDNAMCDRKWEKTVVISKGGKEVADINLAMLLAMACGKTFNGEF